MYFNRNGSRYDSLLGQDISEVNRNYYYPWNVKHDNPYNHEIQKKLDYNEQDPVYKVPITNYRQSRNIKHINQLNPIQPIPIINITQSKQLDNPDFLSNNLEIKQLSHLPQSHYNTIKNIELQYNSTLKVKTCCFRFFSVLCKNLRPEPLVTERKLF